MGFPMSALLYFLFTVAIVKVSSSGENAGFQAHVVTDESKGGSTDSTNIKTPSVYHNHEVPDAEKSERQQHTTTTTNVPNKEDVYKTMLKNRQEKATRQLIATVTIVVSILLWIIWCLTGYKYGYYWYYYILPLGAIAFLIERMNNYVEQDS